MFKGHLYHQYIVLSTSYNLHAKQIKIFTAQLLIIDLVVVFSFIFNLFSFIVSI